MKQGILTAGLLASLLFVATVAADPGERDSLVVGSNITESSTVDTIYTNQSRPLPLRIVTDQSLKQMVIPLIISYSNGGQLLCDSIVWREAAAQPTILPYRVFNTYSNGGADTATLIALVGSAPPSYSFPPGSYHLADVFITGASPGEAVIDSGWIEPVNELVWLGDNGTAYPDWVKPAFDPGRLVILEGNPPPEMQAPQAPVSHVGGNVDFSGSASSPTGSPVTVELIDIVDWDNPPFSPASSPTVTGTNPLQFSWTPSGSGDIGIWRAQFRACDTSDFCVTRELMIQVLEHAEHDVPFTITEYSGAEFAMGITHGNFNNAGSPELAILGAPFGGAVNLAVYETDGLTLNRQFSYADTLPKRSFQAAYLGPDNFLDLVVVGWPQTGANFDAVSVFEGGSDLNFSYHPGNDVIDFSRSSTLGNFDGDASIDLVTGGPFGVEVFESDQATAFSQLSSFDAGDSVVSVNSADFDGDGADDLAIGTTDQLRIFINDGTGQFSQLTSYPQANIPFDIQITNQGADFNGDGHFDLITAAPSRDAGSSQLYAYFGNGDGTFNQTGLGDFVGQIMAVLPGDYNGDGNLDFAYSNAAGQAVSLIIGNGDGTFASERRYPVPKYNPRAMDCLDFDLDGDLDLVVSSFEGESNASFFILENNIDPAGVSATSLQVSGLDNIDVELQATSGKILNRVTNTFSTGAFFDRNINMNAIMDEQLTVGAVEQEGHLLKVSPDPGASRSGSFSLEFTSNGRAYRLALNEPVPAADLTFTIYPGLSSPVLPRPGSYTYRARPLFSWQGDGAFEFQLADDLNFSNVLINETVPAPEYEPTEDLPSGPDQIFYWRVRPEGSAEFGPAYAINILTGSMQPGCGNVDNDPNLDVTIADLTYLVAFMFREGPTPPDPATADVDGASGINISDITYFVGYMFKGGPPLVCPEM